MRRSAIASTLLHLAVLGALLITLPSPKLPESADTSMDVEIIGPSNTPPQMSKETGHHPAPNKTDIAHVAPQSDVAPKKQAIEAPPPQPPPPPPSPQANTTPTVTPKTPTPPVTPTLSPEAKMTPVTPQKPQKPVVKPQPDKKTPPAPHPLKPAVESVTHQVHDVKKPEPLSKNILNTLLNLHAHQDQVKPPVAKYNPDQGGDPDAGGSKDSTANSALSGADKSAIGAHLRPCFQVDAGAPGLSTFHVLLDITTDPQGIIRVATVDPQDQGKMSDPIFYAYAQRALNAALNVQCANLPLPQNLLGSNQNFVVDFAGQ